MGNQIKQINETEKRAMKAGRIEKGEFVSDVNKRLVVLTVDFRSQPSHPNICFERLFRIL